MRHIEDSLCLLSSEEIFVRNVNCPFRIRDTGLPKALKVLPRCSYFMAKQLSPNGTKFDISTK